MDSKPLSGRRILVVDDDPIFYEIVREFLSQHAVVLSHALTLKEAEQTLTQSTFDLILLDSFLPDGFGVQLMGFLQIHKMSMPVLMVTSDDNQASMQKCYLHGVHDYLIKPINLDLMWLKMQRIYRAFQAEQQLNLQNQELERLLDEQRQEEDLARHVYRSLAHGASGEHSAIRSYMQSSSAFNGDFFISGRAPNGNHMMMLVDATGHGLAAAISVLPMVSTLRAMLRKGISLVSMVHEINSKLNNELPDDRFVAGIGVEIDYQRQEVFVINAGMPEVLLLNNNCEILQKVVSDSPPLGIMPPDIFNPSIQSFPLLEGQHLLFHSDGLTEQTSLLYEEFGKKEFNNTLSKCTDASTLLNTLTDAFKSHSASTAVGDDVSLCYVDLGELKKDELKESLDTGISRTGKLNYTLELNGSLLAQANIIGILDEVQKQINLSTHLKQKCFTVFSELVNNAIDHGVLGLESKLKENYDGFAAYLQEREERLQHLDVKDKIIIKIDFNQSDNRLHFSIVDSGKGYQPQADESLLPPSLSGRGLKLVHHLSEHVTVHAPGNRTSVILK